MSTKSSFEARSGKGLASAVAREAFKEAFGESVVFDSPIAPHVAYRIGGPADILVFPQDENHLVALADLCNRFDLPVTIIGSGTNLLVADEGLRGVVVSLARAFRQIELISTQPHSIRCGAGVGKPALLDWAIEHELKGLEFSAGVPGTLGGGIYMNAGTKYGCYADILTELRLFDFQRGLRDVKRSDLYFGYRETAVGDSLVVSMVFQLSPGNKSAQRLEVDRIIAERALKQPLDFPSCGSTFKNPPEGPAAGRLIERAGLKGMRIGDAEISEKHANFILNKGNAKARDILALIGIIKDRVHAQFQVHLECEVILLGVPSELPKQVQEAD